MKTFFSMFLSAVFASAVLVGCGFIDDNSEYVEAEEPTQIEDTHYGAFAKPDTVGFEGPG